MHYSVSICNIQHYAKMKHTKVLLCDLGYTETKCTALYLCAMYYFYMQYTTMSIQNVKYTNIGNTTMYQYTRAINYNILMCNVIAICNII